MGLSSTKVALQLAQRLVEERGITALPVDPFAIAQGSGIEVVAKDSDDEGVSGMLIKSADSFAIVYATHIRSEGFQRFSVAHELGHYFIPGHCARLFGAGVNTHYSRAGFRSVDKTEQEADQFAAGILMPERLFVAASRSLDDDLAAVEALAKLCRTSLVATATRLADTSRIPMAVIVSMDGLVEFACLSQAMRDFPNLDWPKRGMRVPRDSVTAVLATEPSKVKTADRLEDEGEFQDWFGGSRSIVIREQAIGLGRYGRVLTLVASGTFADDSEEDL